MILAIRIVLTIILVGIIAFCTGFAIEEITDHKDWVRLSIAVLSIIMAAIDIWILWGM